jgi:hypothetical protein
MMSRVQNVLAEIEALPTAEKWQIVRQVLRSLEQEQSPAPSKSDWHDFLRATYGILRETPIERWDEGEYEIREPLE